MKVRLPPARLTVIAACVSAACLLATTSLAAQMVGPRMASRAELEAMLDSLQQVPTIGLKDEQLRGLRNQVSGLAYRLEHGDIWPGDQVRLDVGGEQKWTGQFTVTPDRRIELPDIKPLSMEGALHAEAEEAVALQLSKYLREPRVRVEVLKRIGVLGAVASPGFYNVSGSSLVSQVIMVAGGPTSTAEVDKVAFRRLGDRIAEGQSRVAWQSLSLDQLGVISGDELYVPDSASGLNVGRLLLGALGLAATITLIAARI